MGTQEKFEYDIIVCHQTSDTERRPFPLPTSVQVQVLFRPAMAKIRHLSVFAKGKESARHGGRDRRLHFERLSRYF
jgi:hypothetical protein